MNVEIVERKPATFIGLARPFISGLEPDTNAPEVIGKLWDDFWKMHARIKHRVGHDMFGVMYDIDASRRTHPHELMYLAGVEVSKAADLPPGAASHSVSAGKFARVVHRGPITGIGETVAFIYREWLPKSDYEAGETDLEIYGAKFKHDGADSEMEYLISVKPKAGK